MKCPYCGFIEDKVIDSRPVEDGSVTRRRRECSFCQKRFTTYEKLESIPLIVVKKDKSRQAFDREKIVKGLVKACEKRPVTLEQISQMAAEVESMLYNSLNTEVESERIGEAVMERLKEADEISYVRFASVYRQFTDVGSFIEELEGLLEGKGAPGGRNESV
ncbi:MAG: transcriptional regulator NrdR [Oscillospiraceae bacterium]|nr:transcriptional regulator NrdR [Oscillospiraceae bacterium]